jgi:hypothetical protein
MSAPPNQEFPPKSAGIVERLVRDDLDRKRFLKVAGTGAAASFGAFVIAACGSSGKKSTTAATSTAAASNSAGSGDAAIANYALTLEYLETEFYEQVVASGLFSGKSASLIKSFGQQEKTHVEALKGAVMKLGGTPAVQPTGKFPIENAKQVT